MLRPPFRFRLARLSAGALALAVAAACATAPERTGAVDPVAADDVDLFTLVNQSSWALHAIQLTASDDTDWGPDLLEGDVLLPGESVSVATVECSTYDVRIVDEAGADCVLQGFTMCFSDDDWVLTDEDLLVCDIFGEA